MATHVLRLGTRGSLLARTQSRQVADAVERATPAVRVELVQIRTTGDRVQDRPLADLGGKGLFTKELELALLAGTIDFAVHSYKDVPVTMPLVDTHDLVIAAVPERADPRDVLIVREDAADIDRLPVSATVGTGSLRRRCQIMERRPDLNVVAIRGNIDTRMKKLAAGEYDAIVLARAGLQRLGLSDGVAHAVPIDPDVLLPAPGQGALAIQCRRDDVSTIALLQPTNHPETAICVEAERQIVLMLNGDCQSPIGAFATLNGETLTLRAALGRVGGGLPVRRAVRSGHLSGLKTMAEQAAADVR